MDEEIDVPTSFETIRIRVVTGPTGVLSREQRARAQEAAFLIQSGLTWRDPAVIEAAQRLQHALSGWGPFVPRRLDAHPGNDGYLDQLQDEIRRALERGQLVVVEGAMPLLGIPPELELSARRRSPEAEPPPAPRRREAPDKLTFFEARFVDEVGQPIGGVEVELEAGGQTHVLTTNPAGVALLDNVTSMSASVKRVRAEHLAPILEPRWASHRPGKPPGGMNTQSFVLPSTELGGIRLKPAVPNTIVITPPLGKLHVELWDKDGRVRHARQKYEIAGPVRFSGTTDEQGRVLHEQVPAGKYQLTLHVEVKPGGGKPVVDRYEAALVVLALEAAKPQIRKLGAAPRVVFARMRGLLFDTNKAFLLPTALEALRRIRQIYLANEPTQLLIVGHTDSTGEPDVNVSLSKERADSLSAYLRDDVDAWLAYYDAAGKKRWGRCEDRLMISRMPDFATRGKTDDLVEWYQRTRGLRVDGVAGPKTRRALVAEYMSLDGVALADEASFDVTITTHGCGEHFPLAETGFELDERAVDEREDPFDRRVELFLFDDEFGVVPAPGSPDGEEYLSWRRLAVQNDDFSVEGIGREATVIELHDALFRTNSCVVLPEGEAPSEGEHRSVQTVSLFAQTLRLADERVGLELLIAGHTDTTGQPAYNQALSEQRAEVALALLCGDREGFVSNVAQRHVVSDYKQMLSWCTAAFGDRPIGEGGFDCAPDTIDENAATGQVAVRRFQEQYNRNKRALGASAQADLVVDGSVGPKTWGALFDVYEVALREELGETADGVARLRQRLVFVRDEHRALGFGEHHPIDQAHRDAYRSQANRRVEILLFEQGEEPDVELAKSDPDISEIYLPGMYRRVPMKPMVTARRREVRLVDHWGHPYVGAVRVWVTDNEFEVVSSDETGLLKAPEVKGRRVKLEIDGQFVHFGSEYESYKNERISGDIEEMQEPPIGARNGLAEPSLDDMVSELDKISFEEDGASRAG